MYLLLPVELPICFREMLEGIKLRRALTPLKVLSAAKSVYGLCKFVAFVDFEMDYCNHHQNMQCKRN